MGNWERIFEETEGRHAPPTSLYRAPGDLRQDGGPVAELAREPTDCRRRLRDERPALLNLGEEGRFDIRPWANRVRLVDARYVGTWELPVIGVVTAPTAVLIRPDGYVA